MASEFFRPLRRSKAAGAPVLHFLSLQLKTADASGADFRTLEFTGHNSQFSRRNSSIGCLFSNPLNIFDSDARYTRETLSFAY